MSHNIYFRAGQLDYTIPLEISEYLVNEDDYIPWSSALTGLGSIGVVLRSKEGYPYYQVRWLSAGREIVCGCLLFPS